MTSRFNNIYQKKKTRRKNHQKIRVVVDYREKNSLLPFELIEKGFNVEFKKLKVADYIVKGIAIERKTIRDFISSMINRRLVKQLEEMQQYQKKLLFIEGFNEQELYNDEHSENLSNSVRGFLLSIVLKYNTPIIFSKDCKDSARYIELLARKKQNQQPLRVKKKTLNKKERLQYLLEGFPGIGPKTAKKLLQEFKTIENVINADENSLRKIIGKKAEILKRIVNEKY